MFGEDDAKQISGKWITLLSALVHSLAYVASCTILSTDLLVRLSSSSHFTAYLLFLPYERSERKRLCVRRIFCRSVCLCTAASLRRQHSVYSVTVM